MFLQTGRASADSLRLVSPRSLFFVLLLLISLPALAFAQGSGGIDLTGTGGQHTINGRIYFPSGRRSDATIKVRLESQNMGGLTVLADNNGSFSFRNLESGSYTIVVEGGTEYETVRESVLIDDPKSRTTGGLGSVPRVFTVPIYLQFKRQVVTKEQAAVLNAALANVPPAARDLYQKAVEAVRAGATKKAIEQLQSAIYLYPDFSLALYELGVQYLNVGQPDKAAEALASATRLAPDAFMPRLNYGVALLETKRFAEAVTQLRQALKKNDASAVAHYYLGLALINQRDSDVAETQHHIDEAEKELQRAITLSGDQMGKAHYYLGGIYWHNRDYKRAADELEIYLKQTPSAPDAARTRNAIKELRTRK